MTKIGIVENDEKDMALLKNAIEEYYNKNGDRDFNLVCFPSALSFLNDTDKFDVAFLDIMMIALDCVVGVLCAAGITWAVFLFKKKDEIENPVEEKKAN